MIEFNRAKQIATFSLAIFGLVVSACASSAGKPSWVDDPHNKYPEAKFLVGVGSGPAYNAAEGDAVGGLSAILFSNAEQVCKVIQIQQQDGEGNSSSLEGVDCQTTVASQTELEGVEIAERGSAGGEYYALAVLDRAEATVSLSHRMRSLESGLDNESKRAQSATPLEGAKVLKPILPKALERDLLAAQYRVVAGRPWPSSPKTPALEKQYAHAMDSVLFVVQATNVYDETGKEKPNRSLVKGIADEIDGRGFAVSRDDAGTLLVTATITLSEPFTRGQSSRTYYQWDAEIEVGGNERRARAFIVYEESGSTAHAQASMAKKVAIEQAEDVLIRNFRKELDAYLSFAE